MNLEHMLRNPVLRRALAAGEEQMGKVVGRLLSSDRVATGITTLVSSALQAKETFDRGVQQALHAANLPSKEDVTSLKRKLAELESMIDGLSAKVEAPPAEAAGEGPSGPDAPGGGPTSAA